LHGRLAERPDGGSVSLAFGLMRGQCHDYL
jgi:hypothetical protein